MCFTTSASGDPSTSSGCSKYSDEMINAIAEEKVFFATIPWYSPTFTKYSESIQVDGSIKCDSRRRLSNSVFSGAYLYTTIQCMDIFSSTELISTPIVALDLQPLMLAYL